MDSMEFWDLQPILVGFSGVLANLLHFGQPFAYSDKRAAIAAMKWFGLSPASPASIQGSQWLVHG